MRWYKGDEPTAEILWWTHIWIFMKVWSYRSCIIIFFLAYCCHHLLIWYLCSCMNYFFYARHGHYCCSNPVGSILLLLQICWYVDLSEVTILFVIMNDILIGTITVLASPVINICLPLLLWLLLSNLYFLWSSLFAGKFFSFLEFVYFIFKCPENVFILFLYNVSL